MPPIQNKPSSGGSTALVYITLGALLSVWSGIWFLYQQNSGTSSNGVKFVCLGLLLTGIALLVIGGLVGRMAHKVHSAEIAQETAKAGAIAKDPSIAHKV